MKKTNTDEKVLYIIGWIIMLLFILGVVLLKLQPEFLRKDTLPCLMKIFIGLYCPGCGGSRAVLCLLEGKLIRSFLYHPLVIYTVLVGGWFMISRTIEYVSRGKISIGMKYREAYMWIALGLVVANFLIKNILLVCGVDVLSILN